jgi:ComF family protein
MATILPAAPSWRRIAGVALGVVLPARCLRCGGVVLESGALCGDCWAGVSFIAPPFCAVCGLPFEFDAGAMSICGACLRDAPPYRRARAVLRYDAASRDLVIAFKHGDRTDAAPAFARWMMRAGAGLLHDADIVVPVPLHRRRLLGRRFNQAALLVNEMARRHGVAVAPDLLLRIRATRSQGRLSLSARRRNVQGAFAVRERAAARLRGRSVLLVDDVLTTGATVGACAAALLRGGARHVDVLTLARVVRASP